jgi:hypothetical protein
MVLLTLLSIVQALALELLWSHVRESGYLFDTSWTALLTWMQVGWVPSTSDSVYPFVVGLLEFILIETLAPEYMGWWFICLALIFALMSWVSHITMRRARRDGENEEFFAKLEPATTRDFYPAFAIIFGCIVAGIYLAVSSDRGILALLAVSAAFIVLVRQVIVAARFWELSVSD